MKKLMPNDRLRNARKGMHLSRRGLAELLGSQERVIQRWERGEAHPDLFWRDRLCTFFQMTAEQLGLPVSPAPVLSDPLIPALPPVPLVGRDEDLAALKLRLHAGGNVALTALHGLPGIGKTALAIALAHDAELHALFSDGTLWAGLGPHPNLAGILGRWGALLGVGATERDQSSDQGAWARALHQAIALRRLLVVIDDVWKLEDMLALKVGGPNCVHLVTTRFPQIAASVAADQPFTVRELGTREGLRLLYQLAPGVIDEDGALDLVQAVGGLPLALTLVGNYLRKQSYRSQKRRRITSALERLNSAEERLRLSQSHEPVERHPSLPLSEPLSLQSVIAVSDQQLAEPVRQTFYALSVFPPKPNSFSEAAALAIANCRVEHIDLLNDAGLLESSGSGRYTLHQVIAEYASLHFVGTEAMERLIAYAVEHVEVYKEDYERLELENATILAALDAASALNHRALMRMITAYAPFLLARGLYQLAEQYLRRAYDAAEHDAHLLVKVLLYLGESAQRQGKYDQAEGYYQTGLTLARRAEEKDQVCALLADLGWVTLKRGEYAQAEAYLQESLALARQIGDQKQLSGILRLLGAVADNRGDYFQGETYLREGLTIARQIGDRAQICDLLISLGVTMGERGDDMQAEQCFQEGLVLARQMGHRELIGLLLSNLGNSATEQGNYAQAERYLQEGLREARQIGHREFMSMLLVNLGMVTCKQGNYHQSKTYFQECLLLTQQIRNPQVTANLFYEYGNLHLDLNQIERARANFQEMLAIIPEGDQGLLALARYGQARVAAACHRVEEARKLGEESAIVLAAMAHRRAQEVRAWVNGLGE